MKNYSRSFLFQTLIAMILGATSLQASAGPAGGACEPIRRACQVAGFKLPKKGATEAEVKALRASGQSMTKNCLQPVLAGKGSTVAKLKVDPSWDLNSCQNEVAAVKASLKKSK